MSQNHTNQAALPIKSTVIGETHPTPALNVGRVLKEMVQLSCQLSSLEIDAFTKRLSDQFFSDSENVVDSKLANKCFLSAQLLKNQSYAFYHLYAGGIERVLLHEVHEATAAPKKNTLAIDANDGNMSLVSYEEMELKLTFGRISRNSELICAESLTALNMRLATILGVESVTLAQNPFRPEVFIRFLNQMWTEFNPDQSCHELFLPRLSDAFFNLDAVYQGLNRLLVGYGVLPDLQESYRFKRKPTAEENARFEAAVKSEVTKKLEKYLGGQQAAQSSTHVNSVGATAPAAFSPETSQLYQYLAQTQKAMGAHQFVSSTPTPLRLSQISQEMPTLFQTSTEKNTLNLLSHVFDGVMDERYIPEPIKNLLGALQVPILKAALLDRNFFFQDNHPARKLIELISKYSTSYDASKGEDDPLYQAMHQAVTRIQEEFDQQVNVFEEVSHDLEQYVQKEDEATLQALEAPINHALKREKYRQATEIAQHEISLRIQSGEVTEAFVEAFLADRWTKVLTLAYSVKDEKPHAVEEAIKTMDDLIWSVKPKITMAQRQEMVDRLPHILARLNKWLSLIKWEDADREQFFADLAECHASIVRAPLDLTPERQMEIAIESAQLAAERRLAKRAEADAAERAKQEAKNQAEEDEKKRLIEFEKLKAKQEVEAKTQADIAQVTQVQSQASPNDSSTTSVPLPTIEASLAQPKSVAAILSEEDIVAKVERQIENAEAAVANLERGMWLEFRTREHTLQRVRLAWISPQKSLFIFTSAQKEKSFSIAVQELESQFRYEFVKVISVDKVVDRALLEALEKK